jgi:hypothetical protein
VPDTRFDRALPLLFAVTALAVAAFAATVVAAPIETLLLVVPDDAFYYLQIARNLAATGQSTADGFSPTNGYHPLWMAVNTALALVVADRVALVRAALVVSLALHVAAALLVRRIVTRVVDAAWGWTAAVVWITSPLALLMAFQAMECSIYVVVCLIALSVHLRLAEAFAAGRPSWRSLAAYGAVLGLLALARTEGAMIAPVVLLWIGVRAWKTAGLTAAIGTVAVVAITIVLTTLPWFLFSLAQVGTVTQDSGAMKALWAVDLFPDAASRVRNVLDTADYFYRRTWRLVLGAELPLRPLTIVPLAIGAVMVLALRRRWRERDGLALRAIVVPGLVTGFAYGVSLVERQVWWLGLPWLVTIVGGAIALALVVRGTPRLMPWAHAVRAAVLVAAATVFALWASRPLIQYRWQPDVLESQRQWEATVPADQRIGCFNSGIPIYFGSGRVIALDGLVSHTARGFWYDHDFDGFLAHAQVRFVADEQLAMNRAARFTRAPLPLSVVARHPLRGWPSRERVLWRVGTATDAASGPETRSP